MELKIYELVKKIGLTDEQSTYFKDACFHEEPIYHRTSKKLDVHIQLPQILPYEVYDCFTTLFIKYAKTSVLFRFTIQDQEIDTTELNRYIQHAISLRQELQIFAFAIPVVEDGNFIVYRIADENERETMIQNKHILETLLREYGIFYRISIEVLDLNKEVVLPKIKMPKQNQVTSRIEEKKNYQFTKKKSYSNYTQLGIHDIQEACYEVCIYGEIFEEEVRTTFKGLEIQTLWICDDQDAMIMKRFERGRTTKDVLHEIGIKDYVKVYGKVEWDSYLNELVFLPEVIEKMDRVPRLDHADQKRVEFHSHTKLSEMDGVSSIEEYLETANAWGMNAFACTDHMVVQAYPKAQNMVDTINKTRDPNNPFKMIYGVEMNMVDPTLQIVRNVQDINLEEATYCVFDLETTGLSSRFDHIIEFGGQLVQNRASVKALQLFVKPPTKLSAFTTKLTGIKEQDIEKAKTLEECIDEILSFIGDSVLVAHNAEFDYNFLNEALLRMGREPLKNPVIDTLDLARSLHSHRKGYRLGQIARQYGIRYDEDIAHRADYDAEILFQVYMNMLNELKDVHTLQELQGLQIENSHAKVRTKHVNILAKDQEGIKDIFELVTLSHTHYLASNRKSGNTIIAEPRISREAIIKKRQAGHILIGTACFNGEVFDIAQTKGKQQLEEAIAFYDYVEIQPLENYRPLIERNSIFDEARLKEIIMAIIDAANNQNKLIIASGDAHYVDPAQKLIRDIYISAQAIGGVRHPLYIYDSERRHKTSNPDQHFYTTNEMLDAFMWLGAEKAQAYVVDHTIKLAEQVDFVRPMKDQLYPPLMEGSDQKLRDICYQNAHRLYGENLPKLVEDRLEKELDSIIGHGFYVVYYISHLLVKKSLEDGYMVGSRGSVGSSFVATMANITEVNPLPPHYVCPTCHYSEFYTDGSVASGFDLPDKICPNCGATIRGDGQDIPFETFLGFEGDKVPDIDLNFSGDYQPVAHNYTKEVFGEEHVFRAGTIGTVAQQTAFGYVKGYQEEMGVEGTIRRAQILRLAKGCEGVKRTTGQHPGGIIVIPQDMDVHDFTPVQYPANNPNSEWKTTHFEFHDIDSNVLKFDILGHVDPTAMKLLERISGVDPNTISMNDPQTMKIFSSVETLNIDSSRYGESTGAAGIPEFGTSFVRGILEITKPTTFDELVRISGLSHGTDVWLNNAKSLIESGECTLRDVIGCRDDIMVYLLHKGLEPELAFTIMESVRKGKGLKEEWIPEMYSHGVSEWYVDSCTKIKYMFPKAHAVAYVMMAVRIAWFKVHMPIYYYCMFFSIRCDAYDIETMMKGEASIRQRMSELTLKFDDNQMKSEITKKDHDIFNTLELALEMALRGYHFGSIDLLRSSANEFSADPQDETAIIPPFSSIDGLGENVAESIVQARKEGAFLSKEDLLKRTLLSSTMIKKMTDMGILEGLQDENQLSFF